MMKTQLFVVILILGLVSIASAQVWEEWTTVRMGTGDGTDSGWDFVVGANGNIYVTGFLSEAATGYDIYTVKYDSLGNIVWENLYNGPANGSDFSYSIAMDADENVYVAGASAGIGTSADIVTIKYNSAGVQQWVARYDGPGHTSDWSMALALDDAANVYVAGQSTDAGTGYDFTTIKYNSDGVEQWVARYNGAGNGDDEADALALDATGNVYVTGSIIGDMGMQDIVTIKYDPAGVQQWVALYNGLGNGPDVGWAICADAAGNAVVSGWTFGPGTGYDYITIKYDTDGLEQWVATYDGPVNGEDEIQAMDLDADGNVYVTGWSWGAGTGPDYTTIKYNSQGQQQWVSRYFGVNLAAVDRAYGIDVDNQGNCYVTGDSYLGGGTGFDYVTIKYNPNGVQQWKAVFSGPADIVDIGLPITCTEDGHVYVTGQSWYYSLPDAQMTTVCYGQNLQGMVQVSMTPVSPPIQLPASGGSFDFNATLTNNTTTAQSFAVWIMARLPNGTWYGPALGPINLNLAASGTLTRLRTQTVPAIAPAGDYIYEASVGSYPDTIWSNDSFTFTKLATGEGDGVAEWSNSGESLESETADAAGIPSAFLLAGAFPNPFNPTTAISYQLSANSYVRIRVYDTAGRLVETLVDGWRSAGTHELTFDAGDLPSGVYFARLHVGDYAGVQKLILLK
jgi:uncharacterized delta-60 repeat protein